MEFMLLDGIYINQWNTHDSMGYTLLNGIYNTQWNLHYSMEYSGTRYAVLMEHTSKNKRY